MSRDVRKDSDLIEAIAASRDQSALTELLRRYERELYGLALRISGRRDQAEEIVQEAMMRVWTSAASYRSEGEARSWLLSIVARESLRAIREMKRKSGRMNSDITNDPCDSEESPLKSAEASELSMALRRECDRLPELERQLIGLHFGGGLSQPEISRELAIPQQTISYRLNQALKMLRANLSTAGYAAAIPLLSGSSFSDALCAGVEVPPGMREKVTSALSRQKSFRTQRMSRKMNSPTSAGAGGGALAAVAATVVMAVGAIVMASGSASKSTIPPAATPVAPVVSPLPEVAKVEQKIEPKQEDPNRDKGMEQLADRPYRWTFENGVPKDMYWANGKWTWNRETKSMDAPEKVFFFFGYLLPKKPLRITIKGKAVTKSTTEAGMSLFKDNKAWEGKILWQLKDQPLGTTDIVHELYIYQRLQGIVMNGRQGLLFEWDQTAENAAAILHTTNLSIEEVSTTPLTEDELPEFMKNPDSVLKK